MYIKIVFTDISKVMNGCNVDAVKQLLKASLSKVKRLLHLDIGHEYILTKSLLNLLHNSVVVGSIATSVPQKLYFRKKINLVKKLLSKRTSLEEKREILGTNVALTLCIVSTCPGVG